MIKSTHEGKMLVTLRDGERVWVPTEIGIHTVASECGKWSGTARVTYVGDEAHPETKGVLSCKLSVKSLDGELFDYWT